MNIDIFKDKTLWDELEKYNRDIIDVYNKDGGKGSTHWFNPNPSWLEEKLWVRKSNEMGQFFVKDLTNPTDWKLTLHASNYLPVFLTNLLYQNKKDILIEDVCSGMGRMIFYLSKLGFTNFSCIDDFSGVTKDLFTSLMKKGEVNYILNQKRTKPIVSNLAGYPWYCSIYSTKEDNPEPPKEEVPLESCELFCFYCAKAIFETIGKHLLENDYVELCQDQDYTQVAYCKKEKYQEFYNKVKDFKI